MISDRRLTSKEQHILDLITSQNALVSIGFEAYGMYEIGYTINYSGIDEHYLNPILDPNKYRPSRSVKFFSDPWVPRYDILLISLPENTKIDEKLIENAQGENQPILIKRSNGAFSIYSFDYYSEVQWQERTLTNLTIDEVVLLNRLCFDGRLIKKEDGFPDPNSPNRTDGQQIFLLISKSHMYLPAIVSKMNMRTLKIHQHKPGQNRFTKHKGKNFQYAPKISMSLPPPDLRYMELFNCDNGIGFLWDINLCNLKKEKYVFTENAGTDGCYWINLDSGYDYDFQSGEIKYITAEEKIGNLKNQLSNGEIPITTVAALRERNLAAVKNKKPIVWNELVVGPPKGSIQACFATQDIRISRLRALRVMLHVKEKLNLAEDLPLFINQPYYGVWDTKKLGISKQREAIFRFYPAEEQKSDIDSEMADQKVAEAAADIIKNQNALAVLVSDKNIIDKYLESTIQVDTILLPTEPQWMKLSDDTPVVGLIWDINTCDLDDNSRTILPKLEEKNNEAVKQQQVIDCNTLSVTLPTNQLNAMLCYYKEYDLDSRLKALELAAYVKNKLKLTSNLPIFLIQKGTSSCLYTDLNQLMDVNFARWNQPSNREVQQLRHPNPLPPKTPYEKFVEKRRLATLRFFAQKTEEDQDWINVSHEEDQDWVNVTPRM